MNLLKFRFLRAIKFVFFPLLKENIYLSSFFFSRATSSAAASLLSHL
jgi:hypothetical protein